MSNLKKIELTGREYDKTVELYEKTGNTKYLKILHNCVILLEHPKKKAKP